MSIKRLTTAGKKPWLNLNVGNVECDDIQVDGTANFGDVTLGVLECSDINLTSQTSSEGDIMIKDASDNLIWSKRLSFEEDAEYFPVTSFDTTSTTFVLAQAHATPSLTAGKYKIEYSFQAVCGFESEMYLINQTTGEVYNDWTIPVTGANTYTTVSGFDFETISGVNSLELFVRTNNVANQLSILKYRIIVTRIS